MAQPFNLTAQINLQGPANTKQVVASIRRQLTGIKADVELNINAGTAKRIGAINKQLNSLSSAAKNASTNVTGLNSALQRLSNGINNTNQVASTFNKTAAATGKTVNSSSKNIQQASTQIEDFGRQSALAVKRFAAFSVVTSIINRFTGAVSDSFKTFVDFDRQLVRVAQVTGGTAADIKSLSNEIGNLASNFGVASQDLAEVSVTLAQAGLSANQAQVALTALAKTSLAATFTNINNTTEGSIALMRQFKISVQDLEGALGSINAVAGEFAVESSDIITAISRAGGVFAAASRGVSTGTEALQEFVAVFTSVRSTTRESAETIATGLRTIFTRIQRGSTIKFLKEFGIELQDSQGKFVGAYEAIRRLSEGLEGLDPRDVRFSDIVEQLGGFRQIGKVIPLIQEFTTAQEALGVAQRGAGSLTKDAVKAQSALAVQFTKTREEFNSLIREIGQSATFQTITKLVLGMASAFISVAGALKPILPLLTALTAMKGLKFITQFVSGFKGGLGGGSVGGGMGGAMGGAIGGGSGGGGGGGGKKQATQNNTASLIDNTTALSTLTSTLQQVNGTLSGLVGKLSSSSTIPDRLTGLKFAGGGDVPGTGNRDTVPAMLQPGEFVIRKSAVQAFGRDNLASINKYGNGARVEKAIPGARTGLGYSSVGYNDIDGLQINNAGKGALKGYMFEDWVSNKYGVSAPDQKFPDIPEKALEGHRRQLGLANKSGQGIIAAELKYKEGRQVNFDDQYTPENTAVLYAEKMAKGGKAGDTVPAMLMPGEYVINKKSAQAFGYSNLKQINGYAQGGVVDGVQHFSNGGMADRIAETFSDQNISKQLKATGIQVKRFGLTLQRGVSQTSKKLSKNFRVASIQTQRFGLRIDEASKFTGSFVGTFSAGLAALGPQIDSMAESFDRLNSTTIATGEEFKRFSGGLKEGASKGLSGSIAAQQAGMGPKGAALVGGIAFAGGAISGGIAGQTEARQAKFMEGAGSADVRRGQSREDFKSAENDKQRSEALFTFTKSTAEYNTSVAAANKEYQSVTARAGRAVGHFTDALIAGVSAMGMMRMARRGFSDGGSVHGGGGKLVEGPVYASKGQYVDFKPKGTDTVPAMLSPGEFVVNARSTKQNKGLLESINKSKGGMISPQYLASGGMSDFDKYLKQGLSPSEARKKMEASSKTIGGRLSGGASAVGNFFGGVGENIYGYGRNLSQFYNPFDNSQREMKAGDEGIRNMGRASMAVAAAAGTAAGGLALAPALAGGVGGTGAVGTATNAGFGAMDAADFVADPSLATGAMLATNFIPGSGLVKGGARGVKAAKGATQVAKTAKASKTASKASKKGGGFFSGMFGGGKKATPSPSVPKSTPPLRRPTGTPPVTPQAGKTSSLRRDFIGPPAPVKNSAIVSKSPAKKKGLFGFGKRKTGLGGKAPRAPMRKRMRGKAGAIANVAGAALPALAMAAPSLIAGVQAITGNEAEAQAKEQQLSRDRFAATSEGATMRGKVADTDGPMAKRALDNFNDIRTDGGSADFQRTKMGKMAESDDFATANLAQEQRRQEQLQAGGFGIKAGQDVEEFMASDEFKNASDARKKQALDLIKVGDEQLKNDAFRTARTKELTAAGKTAAQIQAQLASELESGKTSEGADTDDVAQREIGRINEIANKQLKASAAAKVFQRQTADLTAIMARAGSAFKKVGHEMDLVVAATNSMVGALGGQATASAGLAGSNVMRDKEVLSNPTAYSTEELDATLERSVAGMGGSAPVQQAADLTRAAAAFEKLKPTLEASMKGEGAADLDRSSIQKILEDGFKDMKVDAPEGFLEAAAESLMPGSNKSGNMGEMMMKAGQASKFLEQHANLAAKGMQSLAVQADGLSNSLSRAKVLAGESAAMQAEANVSLKDALGIVATPKEKTAATNARIGALTGGELDPNEIFNNMQSAVAERQTLESGGTVQRDGEELDQQAMLASGGMSDLNSTINDSRKALEMLANDTTAADVALQRIADRDSQLKQQADTALDLAADPSKALDMIGQAQSLSRVLSGQGGAQDIGAAKGMVGQLEGMIPPEMFAKLQKKMFEGAGASTGLGGALAPFAAGVATDEDGKRSDPILAAEMDAFETANKIRQEANAKLLALEEQRGKEFGNSLTTINDKLNNQLAPIIDQINAELTTFKNKVAAANGGGAGGGGAGAPPPPVGGVASAPPANNPVAGIQLPNIQVDPDTQLGSQIDNYQKTAGNAISSNSATMKIQAPSEPMQVNISLDAGSQAALGVAGTEEIKKAMSRIGDLIYEKTNSSVDIRGMV